ncbi:MAG: hypothetical protein NTX50_05090, partial [Candidatus Sumerlaeota bacterium]|nr:hypothetical protein [Candidatus Sumerlaeota bacterium]
MTNPCKFPPRKKAVYQETPETRKMIRIWNLEISAIAAMLILASLFFIAAIFSNGANGLDAKAMTCWMLALYSLFCAPALWIGMIFWLFTGPFIGVPAFIIASIAQWNYIWKIGKQHILERRKNPMLVLLYAFSRAKWAHKILFGTGS